MSNSMSLEKIFLIIAIILGFGSIIDLIYALATLQLQLAEFLRCIFNIGIAGCLYQYFKKKRQSNLNCN